MKELLLFIGIFVLAGCQSARIHIVAPSFDKQQKQQLAQHFADQNLKVNFAQGVLAPSEFNEASITMSPTFADFKLLGLVKDALRSAGYYKVDELRFAQQQQFYYEGHIGVYLLLPKEQRLPLYVESEDCTPYRTLMLTPEGRWQLDDFVSKPPAGTWRRQGDRVVLTSDSGVDTHLHYERTTRITYRGERPAHVLKALPGTQGAFKCTFVAINMN